MESLIQKHSYARSPIRTYGEEDVLGEESQTTPNRGKAVDHVEIWSCCRPEHLTGNEDRLPMECLVLWGRMPISAFKPFQKKQSPVLVLICLISLLE